MTARHRRRDWPQIQADHDKRLNFSLSSEDRPTRCFSDVRQTRLEAAGLRSEPAPTSHQPTQLRPTERRI